jgi:hypothetical protein
MASQAATDEWQAGDPYERYMGRWSRQLAARFDGRIVLHARAWTARGNVRR